MVDAADKAMAKSLASFGAYTRKTIQNSIKTMPGDTVSRAGNPPFGHTGPVRYKANIFFFFDKAKKSVIIGPVLLNGKKMKPKTLEVGGTAEITTTIGGQRLTVMANFRQRPHVKTAFDKARKAKLKDLIKNSIVKG